jgi:virginiamycin B lyase
MRLFVVIALLLGLTSANGLTLATSQATPTAAGISFDEVRRNSDKPDALRSAPLDGFEADYLWYQKHGPNQYSERLGPAGDDIDLNSYAFFEHWSRFENGGHVTIVNDTSSPVAIILDLKNRTFHRFSVEEARKLLARKPYAPYLPVHYMEFESHGGKGTISETTEVATLPAARVQDIPATGLQFERKQTAIAATGTCVTGDTFGKLEGFSSSEIMLSYRAGFPEPGPAYTLADGLPFTEGEFEVCDRSYVDQTPAVTSQLTEFRHRFSLFERDEYKDTMTEGAVVVERGHIRFFNQFDPALFGIPAGFKDDCDVAPRPANCAARGVLQATFRAEYPVRDYAYQMVAGPRNDVWFLEPKPGKIGTISSAGNIREFTLPASGDDLWQSALGSDGTIWFLDRNGILVRASESGEIRAFDSVKAFEPLEYIAAGPGRIWFTISKPFFANGIASMDAAGNITTMHLPTSYPIAFEGLRFDGNGRLWYIEGNTQRPRVVKFENRTLHEFTPPNSLTLGTLVYSSGYMYFSEEGRLARISVENGAISEFPLSSAKASPWSIAAAPNGEVWFTEYPGNRLGHLTKSGTILECESSRGSGNSIAVTSDGVVWLATSHSVVKVALCGTP